MDFILNKIGGDKFEIKSIEGKNKKEKYEKETKSIEYEKAKKEYKKAKEKYEKIKKKEKEKEKEKKEEKEKIRIENENYEKEKEKEKERERKEFQNIGCGANFYFIFNNINPLKKEFLLGGDNTYGQLGIAPSIKSSDKLIYNIIPEQYKFLDDYKIKQIAIGKDHILILQENNDIYCMGNNKYGQCAIEKGYANAIHNLMKIYYHPFIDTIFEKITNIKNIFCGNGFSLIMDSNNTVYCYGKKIERIDSYKIIKGETIVNENRELKFDDVGNIDMEEKKFFISPISHYFFVLTKNKLFTFSVNNKIPKWDWIMSIKEGKNFKIKNIFCGKYHNFVLFGENSLYGSGQNNNGELGLGYFGTKSEKFLKEIDFFNKRGEKIKKITLCLKSSIFLTEEGKVYSVGDNKFGELGHGDQININVIKEIEFFKNKKIVNICSGKRHTFAITDKNEIYSWGINDKNQLGYKTYDNFSHTPFNIFNIK